MLDIPEMPRPAHRAAALATVRRQLDDSAAFGTTLTPDQFEQIAVRLTELLRGYAEADSRRYPRLRRPLRPRSPWTIHPREQARAPHDPEQPPL